jgi:hypothetical protein
MIRTIASAAAVVVLMPVVWLTSAAWATGLTAGLVAYELKRRLVAR